jgi:hypothetical protein
MTTHHQIWLTKLDEIEMAVEHVEPDWKAKILGLCREYRTHMQKRLGRAKPRPVSAPVANTVPLAQSASLPAGIGAGGGGGGGSGDGGSGGGADEGSFKPSSAPPVVSERAADHDLSRPLLEDDASEARGQE